VGQDTAERHTKQNNNTEN